MDLIHKFLVSSHLESGRLLFLEFDQQHVDVILILSQKVTYDVVSSSEECMEELEPVYFPRSPNVKLIFSFMASIFSLDTSGHSDVFLRLLVYLLSAFCFLSLVGLNLEAGLLRVSLLCGNTKLRR